MQRPRDGFTLVELLSVIAVVAVLTTLLVAGYAQARAWTEQTESVARLRQWGVGLARYVAENEGDLPRRGQGMQPVTQFDRPEDWFNALPPYLKQPGYGELANGARRPRENERSIFIWPGAKDPGGAGRDSAVLSGGGAIKARSKVQGSKGPKSCEATLRVAWTSGFTGPRITRMSTNGGA